MVRQPIALSLKVTRQHHGSFLRAVLCDSAAMSGRVMERALSAGLPGHCAGYRATDPISGLTDSPPILSLGNPLTHASMGASHRSLRGRHASIRSHPEGRPLPEDGFALTATTPLPSQSVTASPCVWFPASVLASATVVRLSSASAQSFLSNLINTLKNWPKESVMARFESSMESTPFALVSRMASACTFVV